MSTTFGVKIPSPDIKDEDYDEDDYIIPIAFRSSYMIWKNELAQLLPDNLPVIAMDNSAQGIYTIGDIKKEINNGNN